VVVPDDYPAIQEAVDAAQPGDTIRVRSGTYCENISINKTLSLIGMNPQITIVNESKGSDALKPVASFSRKMLRTSVYATLLLREALIHGLSRWSFMRKLSWKGTW
jgi:pectin methylesterase-like acyl-CoA thioesterase